MKTFCAVLLVGLIAYVRASHHPCDPLAANTEDKPNTSSDLYNQEIKLRDFNQGRKKVAYVVTKASPSTIFESSRFCSAPTHGSGCQAVGYFRELIQGGTPGAGAPGVKDIRINTVFVGVSGSGKAVQYEMNIQGINEDDYIFQIVPGTVIIAREYNNDGSLSGDVSQTIPSDIKTVLESEFALFYANNGFAIYVTCNAQTIWVSYDKTKIGNIGSTAVELNEQITNLQGIASREFQKNPTVAEVNINMPQQFQQLIPGTE